MLEREAQVRRRLPREFYDRPATEVGPELLGCVLWHDTPAGLVAARLVEVEAYMGAADPASHSYRGLTARNAVMFGPPGHAYVYFSYGMHFCVNLVCGPPGRGEAVLLRAGEIVEGADLATRRRSGLRPRGPAYRDLARGPGRLCQALGINREQDGADACERGGALGVGPPVPGQAGGSTSTGEPLVAAGPRVGISRATDRPWRYWLAGDEHVSVYRSSQPRTARPKPVTGRGGEDGTMQQ